MKIEIRAKRNYKVKVKGNLLCMGSPPLITFLCSIFIGIWAFKWIPNKISYQQMLVLAQPPNKGASKRRWRWEGLGFARTNVVRPIYILQIYYNGCQCYWFKQVTGEANLIQFLLLQCECTLIISPLFLGTNCIHSTAYWQLLEPTGRAGW